MDRRRLNSLVALLLLSVSPTLAGTGLADMVLCFGEGHISLEMANDGRCADGFGEKLNDHQSEPDRVSAQSPHADHCGTCFDLLLASGESVPSRSANAEREEYSNPGLISVVGTPLDLLRITLLRAARPSVSEDFSFPIYLLFAVLRL